MSLDMHQQSMIDLISSSVRLWNVSSVNQIFKMVAYVKLEQCILKVATIPFIWTRAPSQYPKRRLSVRSRKVTKPRDRYFKLSYRFEIWQTHRQHCCRSACQISERLDNSKYKSRGFETLRDLMERRLFGYWDGTQNTVCTSLDATIT